jgi:hypothetical protein
MIVWDFGGGATDITLRTFDGTSFGAGVNLSASGFAVAALNADLTRGEGAINLTDAIFGGQAFCFEVANVIPGTITGNSDRADYKDTVLADIGESLNISNCGRVHVTKVTEPAGETGNFDYTLSRSSSADIDFTAVVGVRNAGRRWGLGRARGPARPTRAHQDLAGEPPSRLSPSPVTACRVRTGARGRRRDRGDHAPRSATRRGPDHHGEEAVENDYGGTACRGLLPVLRATGNPTFPAMPTAQSSSSDRQRLCRSEVASAPNTAAWVHGQPGDCSA